MPAAFLQDQYKQVFDAFSTNCQNKCRQLYRQLSTFTHLLGTLEQVEKVYLASMSTHVSMSSRWKVDIVSSGHTRPGVTGVRVGDGGRADLWALALAAATCSFLQCTVYQLTTGKHMLCNRI